MADYYRKKTGTELYDVTGQQVTDPEKIQGFLKQYNFNLDAVPVREATITPSTVNPTIASRPDYDAEIKARAEGLDTQFTMSDADLLKEEARKERQRQIDAVNELYNSLLEDERGVAEQRMGRTKAIANRAGILDSAMGGAQIENTTKFNSQQQKLLQAERGAKIASIENDMNNRLEEKLRYERELASANYDKKLKLMADLDAKKEENFEKSKANMADLAKSGTMTFDMFKSSQFYTQGKEETGWDDYTLEKWWDRNSPQPSIIKEFYETTSDGKTKVTLLTRKPGSQEIETSEQILDITLPQTDGGYEGGKMTGNGQMLFVPKNFDGDTSKIVVYGAPGQFNKPLSPEDNDMSEWEVEQQAIGLVNNAIKAKNMTGADGKISPEDFKTLRSAWGNDGLADDDFIKNFKRYVNTDMPDSQKAYGISNDDLELIYGG